MPKYVWRDGAFRNPATSEPMQIPKRERLAAPRVVRPFAPYRSVVTGGVVDDGSKRREEVAIAADRGLVPFERIDTRPPGLINDRFAARGGRATSEAAKEWVSNKRRAAAVKTDRAGAVIAE
jgi:hypothetical protein